MQGTIPWHDRLVATIDQALRTLAVPADSSRASPADAVPDTSLTDDERQRSAALLRVNHAGEMAAQALYSGQALVARSEETTSRGARRGSRSSAAARACSIRSGTREASASAY
jgi:3-demethoxyubiquinol 3-hydroxylase